MADAATYRFAAASFRTRSHIVRVLSGSRQASVMKPIRRCSIMVVDSNQRRSDMENVLDLSIVFTALVAGFLGW